MSEDTNSGRTGDAGLSRIRDESIVEPRSSMEVFRDELLGRWQMLLGMGAMLVTTYGLWYMDGAVTKDVIVFAVLSALLTVYFLVTLRNDLKLE